MNMNNGNNLNIQAQLSYSTTIARDHNISLMAMYEMNHGWNDNVSATREYEIYSKPILDLGSQTNIQNSGGYGETANISYLGRLNYEGVMMVLIVMLRGVVGDFSRLSVQAGECPRNPLLRIIYRLSVT